VREISTTAAVPSTTHEHPELACPDCGSTLRLALVRTAADAAWEPPAERDRPGLRAAPEVARLPDFETSIQEHKRELIARALSESNGVMTRAAKALGLKYTTFVAMVHRLGLSEGQPTDSD
jgi:transcriptional regulator with GAF, ATPase, and Fis domain